MVSIIYYGLLVYGSTNKKETENFISAKKILRVNSSNRKLEHVSSKNYFNPKLEHVSSKLFDQGIKKLMESNCPIFSWKNFSANKAFKNG